MKEPKLKTLLAITVAWAAAFVYLCILSLRPSEPFDFSVLIWLIVTLIFQLALLIVSCITLVRTKRKRVPALCLFLPLAVMLYFFTMGQSQLETWQHRIQKTRQMEKIPPYEAVLKQEKLSPGCLARSGYQYEVDEGPPRRVAFIEPGSLLDNYTAIVYDPTDMVLQSNQLQHDSKWNDPKLQAVKELFGGDMVWAEKLRGHWYLCGFT